jgi:hypothetical protein
VPRFLNKVVTGLLQVTGGTTGKVLTSDSAGNATWQDPTVADGSVTTAKLDSDEIDLYVKLAAEVYE